MNDADGINRIYDLLGRSCTRIAEATTSAGGWRELMAAEPEAQEAYGLTPREAASLRAARGIVMAWPAGDDRPRFKTPDSIGRYLIPRYGSDALESFGTILTDSRNRLKRAVIVSKGSLNGSLVHPREVFRPAVVERAAAIILFHNHPSGDPTPSREDRELTKRLVSAGAVMGIGILDHVVVARGTYWSFKEHGDI